MTEQIVPVPCFIRLNSFKPASVHFVTRPEQGREMEAVVLHRVGFLAHSCPKQGQDFKPSAAPLCPNMGQVPHPPGAYAYGCLCTSENSIRQMSGFVLLLMFMLKSRVFSLPYGCVRLCLCLCLCARENQPLCLCYAYALVKTSLKEEHIYIP